MKRSWTWPNIRDDSSWLMGLAPADRSECDPEWPEEGPKTYSRTRIVVLHSLPAAGQSIFKYEYLICRYYLAGIILILGSMFVNSCFSPENLLWCLTRCFCYCFGGFSSPFCQFSVCSSVVFCLGSFCDCKFVSSGMFSVVFCLGSFCDCKFDCKSENPTPCCLF